MLASFVPLQCIVGSKGNDVRFQRVLDVCVILGVGARLHHKPKTPERNERFHYTKFIFHSFELTLDSLMLLEQVSIAC
jgi:hypothetical protein